MTTPLTFKHSILYLLGCLLFCCALGLITKAVMYSILHSSPRLSAEAMPALRPALQVPEGGPNLGQVLRVPARAAPVETRPHRLPGEERSTGHHPREADPGEGQEFGERRVLFGWFLNVLVNY